MNEFIKRVTYGKRLFKKDLNNQDISNLIEFPNLFLRTKLIDLSSIMLKLCGERNITMLFSGYRSTSNVIDTSKIIVDPDRRHGWLKGIGVNSDTFKFSVLLMDAGVIDSTTGVIGDWRKYALTDHDGSTYPGVNKVQIFGESPIIDHLKQTNHIDNDGTMKFSKIMYPWLWIHEFGSKQYIVCKLLIQRLHNEFALIDKNTPKNKQSPSKSTSISTTKPKQKKVVDSVRFVINTEDEEITNYHSLSLSPEKQKEFKELWQPIYNKALVYCRLCEMAMNHFKDTDYIPAGYDDLWEYTQTGSKSKVDNYTIHTPYGYMITRRYGRKSVNV